MRTHADETAHASFLHRGDDVFGHLGDGRTFLQPWRTHNSNNTVLPTHSFPDPGEIVPIAMHHGLKPLHARQFLGTSSKGGHLVAVMETLFKHMPTGATGRAKHSD